MAKDFSQPENQNYLSSVGFKFSIGNLPNVQWFVQSVNLPGLSLGEITTPSPLLDTFIPANNLDFEPLTLSFLVDEDMTNWVEIYNWLVGLSSPETYSQYKNLAEPIENSKINTPAATDPTSGDRAAIYSDATLIIMNSNMNANHQILFKELFPTSLSGITFNAAEGDVEYITAEASFRYMHYTYEKI